MKRPVILSVDDDPAVLSATDRDLRQQYRADYRVIKAASAAEGLEAAKELAARNIAVALFLVDQRMPRMSGIEMLTEARKMHPESRRVLLTAYVGTDVAIAGINDIALDHYLMKPWDPPEDRLYPVLELDRVVVRVIDDGPGIPPDIQSRIFDPFFTTKGVGSGTGLGLDIVRRRLKRLDGEIGVESIPGRTEFEVRLPSES